MVPAHRHRGSTSRTAPPFPVRALHLAHRRSTSRPPITSRRWPRDSQPQRITRSRLPANCRSMPRSHPQSRLQKYHTNLPARLVHVGTSHASDCCFLSAEGSDRLARLVALSSKFLFFRCDSANDFCAHWNGMTSANLPCDCGAKFCTVHSPVRFDLVSCVTAEVTCQWVWKKEQAVSSKIKRERIRAKCGA